MPAIKRVIALGFFDGVHLGHAALLKKARERALQIGAKPAVLSFDVHPDTLVKGADVPLINSAAGRVDIIKRRYDIDTVIFIRFDEKMMRMRWRDFIDSVIDQLGTEYIVIGTDFNCGYKGEGTAERIFQYCGEAGIGCDVIPEVVKDDIKVSSSYIRKLIDEGDIERANEFLGYPHMLLDTVHYGYKLGRTMGAPTINMQFDPGVLIPKFGVYATKAALEDGEYAAVTNIGVRPTFGGGRAVSVESFILDFDGNLYGKLVRVDFYKFLRPEIVFSDKEELKGQISRDALAAKKYFASGNPEAK